MLQIPILMCKNPHMKPEFDWNDLNAFLAIMRSGKLTTAAQLLKVDHTTLSRRVTRLENSLKVKLFDRLTIGYRPTSDAEQLLPEAEAIESLATGIYAQRVTRETLFKLCRVGHNAKISCQRQRKTATGRDTVERCNNRLR